jgi:hypothetical protein
MFAGLEDTDKRFRSRWQWLATFPKVSEWLDIRKLDRRKTECNLETFETGERRLVASRDTKVFSETPRCQTSVENNVVAVIRSLDSTAEITNVLVFRKESPPLRRMEIRIKDPTQVLVAANTLAATLRGSGVVFETIPGPRVPAHEIWLTLPTVIAQQR